MTVCFDAAFTVGTHDRNEWRVGTLCSSANTMLMDCLAGFNTQ